MPEKIHRLKGKWLFWLVVSELFTSASSNALRPVTGKTGCKTMEVKATHQGVQQAGREKRPKTHPCGVPAGTCIRLRPERKGEDRVLRHSGLNKTVCDLAKILGFHLRSWEVIRQFMQNNIILSLYMCTHMCMHMSMDTYMWKSQSLPSPLFEVGSLQRFSYLHLLPRSRNSETVDIHYCI